MLPFGFTLSNDTYAELLVRGDVGVVVSTGLGYGGPRRTSLGKRRQEPARHHRFADRASPGDLTDIGTVVCRLDHLSSINVDGWAAARAHSGDRLDRDVDDDGVARWTFRLLYHRAWVGQLAESTGVRRIGHDNIVHIPAPSRAVLSKAVSDLYALDCVNASHRLSESAVEFTVPHDVATETNRHTEGDDLHNAADGGSFLFGGVDYGAESRSSASAFQARTSEASTVSQSIFNGSIVGDSPRLRS